jgi:hypothetical protein
MTTYLFGELIFDKLYTNSNILMSGRKCYNLIYQEKLIYLLNRKEIEVFLSRVVDL